MEEQPGPPLNQVARGAVVGLFRASKNQNHMFSLPGSQNQKTVSEYSKRKGNLLPTERYPEYWFTPGVVSQIPEFVTKSILAPVASCSNMVCSTPSRLTKDLLPLSSGAASWPKSCVGKAEETARQARVERNWKRILDC